MTPLSKRRFFPCVLIIFSFLITPIISSAATSTTYIYDDLNRLKRVQYSDGSYIEYTYDAIGNRLSVTPTPISGASHGDGYYASAISVSLSCGALGGSGCRVYYTTDGSTPTTASAYYTSPIALSSATILKFFTTVAGYSGPIQTRYYTFDVVNGIKNVRTSAVYSTLQAAYNAAISGDTIKLQAGRLYQGIDANRNISITLEGGYNSNYLYNMGYSRIKGVAQTRPGGGTVTIKNFNLETQ